MANEKLTPTIIKNKIRDIEQARLGETSALSKFTKPDGSEDIPNTLSDGKGLFLMRQNSGSWLWFYRYRIHGKASRLSFGKFPEITLAEAREKHQVAYRLVKENIDPSANRKEKKLEEKQKSIETFKHLAEEWYSNWIHIDITTRYAETTWRRLEKDIFPNIADVSIHTLDLRKISPIFEEIDKRAPVVATKLWTTCRNIFAYACIRGILSQNPLANINRSDLLVTKHKTQNQLRVEPEKFPELLKAIDSYSGILPQIGLQLMSLLFVRPGELRNAAWDEFDFDKKLWTIPATKMKMRRPHLVPLSKQAIVLLQRLKEINGHHTHLFPSTKGEGKVMSDGTLNKALNTLGYKGRQTVHGFRGNASTILHELGYNHDHIELQLAHIPRNKVSAAYNHATYLEHRAKMMQDWADHLDALRLKS